jgi:hypothetical protein
MPVADALSISFPFIVVILLVSHLPSSFSFEPTAVTSGSVRDLPRSSGRSVRTLYRSNKRTVLFLINELSIGWRRPTPPHRLTPESKR